ncbi:MAG: acyl-CoA dehydrogenase family protein [Hyphomicrobiaceae bacterium]
MTPHKIERDPVEAAQHFADTMITPNISAWTDNKCLPRDAFTRAAAVGLTGIEVPQALGGMGCSFSTKMRIAEILAAADFGVAMALINTHNVARKLADHPDTFLAKSHLPALLKGDRIGCTALTEPGAGSDFAAITTRGKASAGGWVLNGEKAWITNATVADCFVTYIQTKEAGDISGIACVLVEANREGFVRGTASDPVGLHTIGSGSFRLVDYIARDAEMIGNPGAAFKSILREINGARIYVAAMCCGMLQSAIDIVGAYGARRQTFGKPLVDHQGWRWVLAEAASQTAAVRALVQAAAAQLDANADVQLIAAQTKIVATRAVESHLPALAHLMGAEGLRHNCPLGRHLVGARFAGLVDGSTEMLLERVAKLTRAI